MTVIIFGARGQDGFFLHQLLTRQGIKVIGVSRSGDFVNADVADHTAVKNLIVNHQPAFIFHLAANSTTRHDALFENHKTITNGCLNILDCVKNFSPSTRVFISGSGLQFKNKGIPIRETDEFEARDPYSLARIHSVYAARYFRSLGIKAYVGYLFNHDSPLRTENHMTKKISEAAKRVGAGSKEKLEIGDIAAVKEYSYAGDIVKGIWTLVSQDELMEANIGSGIGHSIEEWLSGCFSLVNKDWKDHVIIKKDFVRDYDRFVSDPSLINSLGWKTEVSFRELAKMMMS